MELIASESLEIWAVSVLFLEELFRSRNAENGLRGTIQVVE
jgi:hypothetical protein